MANEVSISNLALRRLRVQRIDALDEDSASAQHINDIYDMIRDMVLCDFDWNFAAKHVTLALLSDETYLGYDYAYSEPDDCLKCRYIYNSSSDDPLAFELAEGTNSTVICTDEEDAELIYTAQITDCNKYASHFSNALSWRLAAELAMPLLGDVRVQQAMYQGYRSALGYGASINANEGHVDPDLTYDIIDART